MPIKKIKRQVKGAVSNAKTAVRDRDVYTKFVGNRARDIARHTQRGYQAQAKKLYHEKKAEGGWSQDQLRSLLYVPTWADRDRRKAKKRAKKRNK